MKTLLTISVIFVIGGTLGWILEFFYRRLAHGKWINPGFLTVPACHSTVADFCCCTVFAGLITALFRVVPHRLLCNCWCRQ